MRAIREANGDKQLAARLLGIGKTTLYPKIKLYETSRPASSDETGTYPERGPASSLFESPGIGFAVCNADLKYVVVNKSLAIMIGLPIERHLGKTVRDVLGTCMAAHIESLMQTVLETRCPVFNQKLSGKLPARAEQGHWLESVFPIKDVSGRVGDLGVVVVEITTQKQLEKTLSSLNEQFVMSDSEQQHRIDTTFVNHYYECLRSNLCAVTTTMERLMNRDIAPSCDRNAIRLLQH